MSTVCSARVYLLDAVHALSFYKKKSPSLYFSFPLLTFFTFLFFSILISRPLSFFSLYWRFSTSPSILLVVLRALLFCELRLTKRGCSFLCEGCRRQSAWAGNETRYHDGPDGPERKRTVLIERVVRRRRPHFLL